MTHTVYEVTVGHVYERSEVTLCYDDAALAARVGPLITALVQGCGPTFSNLVLVRGDESLAICTQDVEIH